MFRPHSEQEEITLNPPTDSCSPAWDEGRDARLWAGAAGASVWAAGGSPLSPRSPEPHLHEA